MNAHKATNQSFVDREETILAHNYSPLSVVVAEAEGAWVTDVEGKRYLDALAGYSALNFGHRHPALIEAAHEQLDKLTLTSRAFRNDQLAPFAEGLANLTKKSAVLPMNTGAEAVETSIKLARKWAYEVKGVPADTAEIIVMEDNFHGRTTTIVSFSTDPVARNNYGPVTPGFVVVPYGDVDALRRAFSPNTAAVLMEPIQGESGVKLPPPGYMAAVRELCSEHNALFIADEIQSGLGRAGATVASWREDVDADVYTLGKALGGGVVPVSAVVADRELMDVFTPGSHGSTFGGNPLAAAVGAAVVELLAPGRYQEHAKNLEGTFRALLEEIEGVTDVRVRGMWAGVDIDPARGSGKDVCEGMAKRGVLAKETHGSTLRLAPPLIVGLDELELIATVLAETLDEM